MNEIILHHYPSSPFAEKVRIALGLKQLAWHSVNIPIIMPKPDLMALTGGYRKTPVMQIGADVYCDTQCILRELERRFPEPSFYRGTDAGTANALAFWADRNLFSPAVTMVMAGRAAGAFMTPEFLADRSTFMGREIEPERIRMAGPFMLDQLRAQLGWLASMLADGRPYLQGQQPTLFDLAAYHPCWFIAVNAGADAAPLSEFAVLRGWMERVGQIGHGKPTELDPKQALNIARQATSQAVAAADGRDPLGRKPGVRVAVVPDDNGRDPVVGELICSTRDDIAIRRSDPQVGDVAVHFPRAGFLVQPAAA
jgi:glutathione S-transferase